MANVQDIGALSEGNDGNCRNQEIGGNGWNSAKIAQVLNLRIEMVEMERAHIDRHNQMRRKFLATGALDLRELSSSSTVFRNQRIK